MNTVKNIFLLTACLCILGCNSDSSEDDTYEDMLSGYTSYTVEGLWDAYNNDEDVSGTVILLYGVVDVIDDLEVTIKDTETNRVIDCTFISSMDLSSMAEDYTVTIRGTCYFDTENSRPYLDDCDYSYVNSD